MVCAKCQKKLKSTELATPGVKRKNDIYYGSPASTVGGGSATGKATMGTTGVSKVCSMMSWPIQCHVTNGVLLHSGCVEAAQCC